MLLNGPLDCDLERQEEHMKSKLVLCSMVLGCSMGLMAQQSSAPGSAPGTTPPTFPQDQSQQQTSPDRQVGSQPGQMGTQTSPSSAPDQTATPDQQDPTSTTKSQTGQMDNGKSEQKQKVEGCLSGTDGNFSLTDKSGMTYQLQGENSDLSKHVGQEVRIEGMVSAASSASSSNSSSPSESSASSSPTSSSSSGNTLMVHKVKKISDSCSTSTSPSK